ncbi:MAG: 2-oxo-4-hydroxy-4-carboxy-5-ureidoimidazoline decarboxylase [Vicinamibacterales bacterium]
MPVIGARGPQPQFRQDLHYRYLVTVGDLNELNCERFVAALGGVFEDSSWVAERAWARRPFGDLDDLHTAMVDAMESADASQRLALLRAHPDLGARARMSTASATEQAGAGLDRLSADEFERLHRMNAEYRDRFGFPFIYAVRGSTTHDILAALDARRQNMPGEEMAEALRQVTRIARFRLEDLLT